MRLTALAPVLGLALAAPAAVAIPDTAITSGPSGRSTTQQPQFSFTATEPSSFECSLDDAPYNSCQSPVTLAPLGVGGHVFRVRALTPEGADATPSERRWTYVGTSVEPPRIEVTQPATRRLRRRALRRVAGTATADSRVTRVEVALRLQKYEAFVDRPAECRFADLDTGALGRRPCLFPYWFDAKGTERWRLNLTRSFRRRIPPGRYWLMVRARNSLGQAMIVRRRVRLTR